MVASDPVTTQRAWLLAARPRTLPAAVGPVLVGTALAIADGRFAWGPALACLACALLLQVGSNFANDYFDFFRGADTEERLGPTRVTSAGLLSPAQVRLGIAVVFGVATLIGLYLVWVGGWPVLVTGFAAIVAALLYSGGPLPYGYHGLGELFCFIFFGFAAVVGTYYVQALSAPGYVWLAAVPVGSLITAILVVNNLRDIATDAHAGKKTVAVLLGDSGARAEWIVFVALAYLATLALALVQTVWVLLALFSLPIAWKLMREVRTLKGRALNKTLAGTARLSLVYSVLLAIGLALA